MAEAILNREGAGRFVAQSAGSHPTGVVNPGAILELQNRCYRTGGLRSKSWDEFAGPDAPQIDFVFTVCDNAAGETCPLWSGGPITAHWGIADPAAVSGPQEIVQAAFTVAYDRLYRRIQKLIVLPVESLSHSRKQEALDEIGSGQQTAAC